MYRYPNSKGTTILVMSGNQGVSRGVGNRLDKKGCEHPGDLEGPGASVVSSTVGCRKPSREERGAMR